MNLIDLFRINFVTRADKIALRFEDRALTFGELDTQSNRIAHAFQRLGLKRGDRFGFYLGNSVELILAHLANLKLGLVLVPMNTQYRDLEITHMVNDAEPRVILTDQAQAQILEPLRPQLKSVEHVLLAEKLNTLIARESAEAMDVRVDGDNLAAIMYTSGTTGRFKGAMLSHDNFVANITGLANAWAWAANDTLLLALPLFHAHGLAVALNGALTVGCTTILHRSFRADRALDALMNENVTLFMGVPTMYVRLIEEATKRDLNRVQLPQMRLFVSGSAPLSVETFERFEILFGHKILERYGMTETVMNISNLYAGARIPGTVGVPLPGITARVGDERGNALPDGKIGEILLRGSNVFQGYWRAPEKTADAFITDTEGNRWFRTGDLGKCDPTNGYLTLLSRRSDLIISGGYNIYPREVEELLLTHPAILDVAVVGAHDTTLGEVPIAFAVCRLGQVARPEDLIEFCGAHLARYKIPRTITFLDALPRNAMGKVEKQKLKSNQ
ncbi:malonyl-CoA/methylmalonyl-CoA synthetase [Anaerolineae bacterium]|nr:malonyl-CoA/methylmalonyl-CoA synthetase [Anaerolineae bacterium]